MAGRRRQDVVLNRIDDESPRGRLPAILVAGAVIAVVAAHAGAWLYYRARQPGLDDRTRDRLQPRP